MRYFGLDEANQLIPLLNRVFERVRPWSEQARKLANALELLQHQGRTDAPTQLLREEYEGLLEQIRAELRQLLEMGIEVKAADGLVDFRAQLSGRTVYLCWHHGEASVSHWHDLETGFSGRRPIDDPDAFAATYLS